MKHAWSYDAYGADKFTPVLCLFHFHTVAEDLLLYTFFISQSDTDDRKWTYNWPFAKPAHP